MGADNKDKVIHFVAGLPRSGSELLCAILDQNPRFHTSVTSGLPGVVEPLKDGWDTMDNHKALPLAQSREKQHNILYAVMQGYYRDVAEPVVFDKSRAWPGLIETLEWVLPHPVKVLATVRNVVQILESLEQLYRKRLATGLPSQAIQSRGSFTTLQGRADYWITQPTFLATAYQGLRDAVLRGKGDFIHFVRFEDLTSNPAATMAGVYEFLGEEPYQHDFDDVIWDRVQDDRVHGFDGLHQVRPKVEPVKPRHELGQLAQKYQGLEFWDV